MACAAKTDESRGRKCGFSVKFWGVGGRAVQEPIASCGVAGSVGRRESRRLLGS